MFIALTAVMERVSTGLVRGVLHPGCVRNEGYGPFLGLYMTLARGGGFKIAKKSTQMAKKLPVCDCFNDIFGLRRRMAMIRRALCCPDPGQCVRYPQHDLSMLRTSSKASKT